VLAVSPIVWLDLLNLVLDLIGLDSEGKHGKP
jgi:hypothetical protein